MLDRLSSVEERYEELNKLLSDPLVVGDYTKVQKLYIKNLIQI